MSRYKQCIIPLSAAICFVITSVLAISFKMYESQGVFPLVREVLFSSPICYFWMLWIALIYFCVNGIYKEYLGFITTAQGDYPLVSHYEIKKIARYELAYSYSKKLMLLFAGLPLAYIATTKNGLSGVTWLSLVILLIPFIIDVLIFFILRYKLTRK